MYEAVLMLKLTLAFKKTERPMQWFPALALRSMLWRDSCGFPSLLLVKCWNRTLGDVLFLNYM